MSRTLHELTLAERSAYEVFQSKLADRTLPASEHDMCRREIDNLLWKGPNAQLLIVKAELAKAMARIDRLEFHAGLDDSRLLVKPRPVAPQPITQPITQTCGGITPPISDLYTRPVNKLPPLASPFDPSYGNPAHATAARSPQANSAAVSVEPAAVSVAAPSDPFDIRIGEMSPGGLHIPNPHPSDADTPYAAGGVNGQVAASQTDPPLDEKKAERRGRPKGAKNKPKAPETAVVAPPVETGEGKEQPATTVVAGSITEAHPDFAPVTGQEGFEIGEGVEDAAFWSDSQTTART